MAEREPEEIEQEIEQTREEMGETVEALAEKADVKAQAEERVEEVKARARGTVEDAKAQARAKIEGLKATVREKKDQVTSGGAGEPTTGPGITPGAPPVGEEGAGGGFDPGQVLAAVRENAVPVAVGALVAGFLIGRLTSR